MTNNNNQYRIIIQLPNEGTDTRVVSGGNGSRRPTQTDEEKQAVGAFNAVKGMVSFAAVRAFANNLISYEISQVELRTGAREYEQKLRFGYEVGNQLLNIGMATAMGGMTGGVVGAVVGFIGSTMYTAIGYAQNANTLRTKQTLEDISIGMANVRAGVSGRRGTNQ